MEFSTSIRDFSRFNLYKNHIPEKLSDRTSHFLLWSRDAFHSAKIPAIEDVVAYTPSKWAWNINSLQVIIFARYESRIKLIDQLSELLAPIYEDTMLLPIIVPVEIKTWPMHVKYESKLFHHVSSKCIYLFASEADQ